MSGDKLEILYKFTKQSLTLYLHTTIKVLKEQGEITGEITNENSRRYSAG